MKRRLVFAVSAAALAATVGVGATFALFTATEDADLDMVAGTLCIDVDRNDGDPVPGPMFYVTPEQGQTPSGTLGTLPTGLWAPGDTETRTMTIFNDPGCSSMNAWVTSVEADLNPEFLDQYTPMAEKLQVVIKTPQGGGSDVVVANRPLSDFLAGPVPIKYPDNGKIPVYLSGNRHMEFEVTFDRGAGNDYQDKTLVVDFIVNAEQMRNNP